MRRPRCPDPELIALLLEHRIDRRSRRAILAHAADCTVCRRQLAIGSLSPWGPWHAALARIFSAERLAVAPAVLALPLLLWITGAFPEDPEPLPRNTLARSHLERPAPLRPLPVASPTHELTRPLEIPSEAPLSEESEPVPRAEPEVVVQERPPLSAPEQPVARSPRVSAPEPGSPAETEAPRLGTPELNTSQALEVSGRMAILDPFGSLALEGAGGRLFIQSTYAVPAEDRLLALGRPSGFRLADGLRVQLAAGSSVSVFHSPSRQCPGLAVHQGSLLVESPQRRSLVLGRGRVTGTLEGLTGMVHVSAGTQPGAMAVTPLGSGAVWRRSGEPDLEVAMGDLLSFDPEGQALARHGSRPRPSLARFISWPEQTSTLYYATFEGDVYAGERPVVVQGSLKDGYLSAIAAAPRKKVIELVLPPGVLPNAEAVVRLRLRTTASRIQCGGARTQSTSFPIRARSETVWTSISLPLKATEPDGLQGGGGGRYHRNGRGNLLITVEGPARVTAEDLTFDLDQVEIVRS